MVQYVSAEEAVSLVRSGDRIFSHGSACTPNHLIDELAKQASRLKDVEFVSITQQGKVEIAKPEYKDSFYLNSLIISTHVRQAVNCRQENSATFFLSQITILFMNILLPLDVAMITVSPPYQRVYCTLSTSVDVAIRAVHTPKITS